MTNSHIPIKHLCWRGKQYQCQSFNVTDSISIAHQFQFSLKCGEYHSPITRLEVVSKTQHKWKIQKNDSNDLSL